MLTLPEGDRDASFYLQCHSRLVLLAISPLEGESDKKLSMMTSLCLWNEIHHHSFTRRSRPCAFSGNIQCVFSVQSLMPICFIPLPAVWTGSNASWQNCPWTVIFLCGSKQAKHFCAICSTWFPCHFSPVKIRETVIQAESLCVKLMFVPRIDSGLKSRRGDRGHFSFLASGTGGEETLRCKKITVTWRHKENSELEMTRKWAAEISPSVDDRWEDPGRLGTGATPDQVMCNLCLLRATERGGETGSTNPKINVKASYILI